MAHEANSAPISVEILATTDRLHEALRLLAKALDGRPEAVDCFLRALDSGTQLVRADLDDGSTSGACELRVGIEPSDWLLGFLAALGAGNV